MKESVKSKTVVVSVIFLFFALAVVPGISVKVVNAPEDNDLVEFTTETYGIPGLKPQTVKLTKQQARDVEELFDGIKSNLDNATTREETVAIFTKAVAELDEYGLLGGVSVKEAQRLVKGRYQNPLEMNLHKTVYGKSQILNNSNFLCLMAGQTKETRFYSLFETGCSALCYFLFGMYIFVHILVDDPVVLINIISRLQTISNLYHTVNSVRIVGTGEIAFGSSHYLDLPPTIQYDPAVGWITTQGVLGKKSWNGSFYGGILGIVTFDSNPYSHYIGATRFLGIKVNMYDGSLFFLGSAIRIKINSEHP